MKNVVKGFSNMASGRGKKLSEIRKDICKTCPLVNGAWCGVCKCFLPAKTTVATESCPKGKW